MKFIVLAIALILSVGSVSHAKNNDLYPSEGTLIAQDTDAYDPFADYSEFDEATDEEADIYFFKNGRFFSIGLIGGYQILTDTYGQIYENTPDFGLSLTYFFDLRLAMQVSYLTGDHHFNFMAGSDRYTGTLTISGFSFDLKYYLNVQNVTKGISDFNPYIFGGLSQLSRELRRSDADGTGKDSSTAFEIGIGTEFPLAKNKYHFGLETSYQYVNFGDKGTLLTVDGTQTNIRLDGNIIRVQAIIGFNF